MPKQFQRTKGLKTGIGVGDAQLWGKSDAVGVAQKQQQIELQKKKYGLAEKKQKADALKAKAKIMQGLAPTGQGYFLEGFNLTEDGYLDTYKQIYGNTNWDDPRSVADTQTAFNNLKRELNILQESDELVKGKFQKLDLDKSYVGEKGLKGLVESKEAIDPVDAQVIISAFRERHDVTKDMMDAAGKVKADLKVWQAEGMDITDKRIPAAKRQAAKDSLWDTFQNNYSVETNEKWETKEDFEKEFDTWTIGKERTDVPTKAATKATRSRAKIKDQLNIQQGSSNTNFRDEDNNVVESSVTVFNQQALTKQPSENKYIPISTGEYIDVATGEKFSNVKAFEFEPHTVQDQIIYNGEKPLQIKLKDKETGELTDKTITVKKGDSVPDEYLQSRVKTEEMTSEDKDLFVEKNKDFISQEYVEGTIVDTEVKDGKEVKTNRLIRIPKTDKNVSAYSTISDSRAMMGVYNEERAVPPTAENSKTETEDEAALKWAKENPNDPRAKKILNLNK